MVTGIKTLAMVACGMLLATTVTATAVGQTTSALAFVQPMSPAAVQAVQEPLQSGGTYSGAVDGVWGPDSGAALQQFQSNHQLQVTGQLNQATAAAGHRLGRFAGDTASCRRA